MRIRGKALAAIFGLCIIATATAQGCRAKGDPVNILRHTVKDIEGNEVDLNQYRGNVVMIVNVASKCGFTDQYAELEALYANYKDRGFVVLGFPSNDFLRQEPGSNEDIQAFCQLNYGVTFPMFAKIRVLGFRKAPLYKDLTGRRANPQHAGWIKWNFTKFLVGRDGTVIDRFAPTTKPDAPEVVQAIETALDAAPED